jgi:sugar/nucleoside kinase (ribokinase family)
MRLAHPEATSVVAVAAADVLPGVVVGVGVDVTAVAVAAVAVDTVGAGDVGTTKFASSRLTGGGSASGAPTMDSGSRKRLRVGE